MTNPRAFARTLRLNGVPVINVAARCALRPIHFTIEERAALASTLARSVVDGRVGVVSSGMDCDCTRFHSEHVMPFEGLLATQAWVERRHMDAEGPLSISFARPDQVDDGAYDARDLALEAFEDGHPHVVYA